MYGQIPLPAFNWVKASQTELHIHIVFDGNRVFQAQMKLWGVSEEKGTKVGETDGVKEGPDGMKKGYPEGRSCSGKVEIFLFICFHIPSLFPPFPFPLPPPSFSLLLFLSSLSPFFIFLSSLITTLPQSFWFLHSLFFLCSSVSFPPS